MIIHNNAIIIPYHSLNLYLCQGRQGCDVGPCVLRWRQQFSARGLGRCEADPSLGRFGGMQLGFWMGKTVAIHVLMDWFKGKITRKAHIFYWEIYGFRLRFSLKPIH